MNENFEQEINPQIPQKKSGFLSRFKFIILGIIVIAAAAYAYMYYYPKYEYKELTKLNFPADIKDEDKAQFEKNLEQVLNAHENDPKKAVLYSDIGILRSGLNDHEGAAEAFKKAISLDPNDARFYRNLAISYTAMEKFKDAEKEFLEVYSKAPTFPEYWLELGDLYTYKIKDTKAARLFYQDAMQKTSDNFSVMQAYANFLDEVEKDYVEAIKYYEKLAEKSDSNKVAYLKRIEELKLKLNK